MKANIKHAQERQKGEWVDEGIEFGLCLAVVALNQEYNFGKKMTKRLLDRIEKLMLEIKGGAKRLTEEYQDNLEYGFLKISEEAKKIIGDVDE